MLSKRVIHASVWLFGLLHLCNCVGQIDSPEIVKTSLNFRFGWDASKQELAGQKLDGFVDSEGRFDFGYAEQRDLVSYGFLGLLRAKDVCDELTSDQETHLARDVGIPRW